MTINKQLTVLMLIITLFSIIVATITSKIADTAIYHQLNGQHFNHLIELNEVIAINPDRVPDTGTLKVLVK